MMMGSISRIHNFHSNPNSAAAISTHPSPAAQPHAAGPGTVPLGRFLLRVRKKPGEPIRKHLCSLIAFLAAPNNTSRQVLPAPTDSGIKRAVVAAERGSVRK